MGLSDKYVQDLTFVEMIFAIVLSWVIVTLWQRCLDNFTFNTLGLNRASSYQTGVIALSMTILFIAFIFIFENLVGDVIESSVSNDFAPPTAPAPSVS